MTPATPAILIVDDQEDDVELTRISFRRAGVTVDLHHATNGREGMDYLRQRIDAGGRRPDLLLLDLNMPVMNGREMMGEILNDDALRDLPVVIFTTSSDPLDIADLYRLRCSTYVTKPVGLEAMITFARDLHQYWFSIAKLPDAEHHSRM